MLDYVSPTELSGDIGNITFHVCKVKILLTSCLFIITGSCPSIPHLILCVKLPPSSQQQFKATHSHILW